MSEQLEFLSSLDIRKESSERILELIRMGYPQEKGEPYTRWVVMDEIDRRGLSLL